MARRQKSTQHKGKSSGPRGVRGMWSGTISFGLVNVPVDLFPAVRSSSTGLRMLDEDGTPVRRQYYSPANGREVHPEHILRGYEIDKDQYVVIRDEELDRIAPRKSREIDLRHFVDLREIPPQFFQRAYYLTPSGESTKAYRLLAEVMESSQRAGIATFVMRGKEYLVAILAEHGILRAQLLRFEDEIRSPDDVGLPSQEKPERSRVSEFSKTIRKLSTETIDPGEMQDRYAQQLHALVERKQKKGEDVITASVAEPEPDEVEEDDDEMQSVDLLETIRRSLRSAKGSGGNGKHHQPRTPAQSTAEKRLSDSLERKSKDELYRQAQELDVQGRSSMTKDDLIKALRKRTAS